jgi:hypothetical protein
MRPATPSSTPLAPRDPPDYSIVLGASVSVLLVGVLVAVPALSPAIAFSTSWVRFTLWGALALAGLLSILTGYLLTWRRVNIRRLASRLGDPVGFGVAFAASGVCELVVVPSGLFDPSAMGTSLGIVGGVSTLVGMLLLVRAWRGG